MSNQPSTEQTLQKTLSILVHQAQFSPEELAILRLDDLHLAGKTPNITFTPGGENAKPKKVDLNLDSHRALVGWLVARPDSVTDYLFIDDDLEGISPEGIRAVVANEDAIEHTAAPDKTDPAGEGETANTDAPLRGAPTTPVPPVRPAGAPPPPPPSAPEMGAPPSGFVGRPPFSQPPPTAPEAGPPRGRTVPVPPPFAPEADVEPPAVKETLPETEETVADSRESKPIPPPPEGMRGPRVPPKPIRKQGEEPSPVLVKQDPEKLETPTTTEESEAEKTPIPVVPPPVPLKPEAVDEEQASIAKESVAKAAAAGAIVAEKSKSDVASDSAKETAQPEVAEKEETDAAVAASVSQEPGEEPAKPEETKKEEAQTAAPPVEEPDQKPAKPAPEKTGRPMLPVALGGFVVLLVLLCIACFGATGWLAMQEKSNGDLLASLGLSSGEAEVTPEDVEEIVLPATSTLTPTPDSALESQMNSPLATPTLPPTHTATPLPATNTPVPTNTPEPEQEEPTATNTPLPTNTPVPPTNTPTPPDTEEETPTPEPEATEESGFKYDAPVLLAPKNETLYTGINEIKLEWESVGELAADEQYAVRIVYKYNGEITYGGAQVKEPNWVVPIALYGKIDPPENRYEWFVAVERLNEDGSGTAVSPESERRSFIWR